MEQDVSVSITLPISITTLLAGSGIDTAKNAGYTNGLCIESSSSSSITLAHIGYPKTVYWIILAK